jgi:glutamine synthetase
MPSKKSKISKKDKPKKESRMGTSAKDIIKRIKDEEIEWVDVRFTDPKGKWQHLTMCAGVIGEDELEDGLMFDGSSIEGWKAINESDMILKPDLDAVYVDPFSATPMMIIFCDIVEPSTGELYSRDPRSTAKRAEAYLKTTGIGDTVYVGPEAEFFMFDDVRFEAAIWAIARAQRVVISQSRPWTAQWTSVAKWFRPCSKWACLATSITMKLPQPSMSLA